MYTRMARTGSRWTGACSLDCDIIVIIIIRNGATVSVHDVEI
jgi:hypothetical protein